MAAKSDDAAQTLRDWVHRHNEAGVDGLALRKPLGAAPKLSEAQMSELRGLVLAGPDPKADKVVRWPCRDLRADCLATIWLAGIRDPAPPAGLRTCLLRLLLDLRRVDVCAGIHGTADETRGGRKRCSPGERRRRYESYTLDRGGGTLR